MSEPKKKIVMTEQMNEFIYILNGFVKKTQKTPLREIRKARQIMKGLGL